MATPIYRFLTDDGLVVAAANFEIASTADKFYVGPPDGEYWVIHRAIIYVEDNGSMTSATYGTQAALTNGCIFCTTSGGPDGSVTLDLLGANKLKSNGDWAGICFDMDIKTAPGGGNDIMVARYTFANAGKPLILAGHTADKVMFQSQDDLSSIISHTVMVQGYSVKTLTGNE